MIRDAISGGGPNTLGGTDYLAPWSEQAETATETNVRIEARSAFTWQLLQMVVTTAGTSLTAKSRINGADGNQTVTSSASTGTFTDITNTDSVSATNEICYSVVDVGTNAISSVSSQMDDGGNNVVQYSVSENEPHLQQNGINHYIAINGSGGASSNISSNNAADFTSTIYASATWRYMTFLASGHANGMTVTSNVNGSAGNQTATSTTTGMYEDVTNSDSLSSGDDIVILVDQAGTMKTDSWTYVASEMASLTNSGMIQCAFDTITALSSSTTYYFCLGGDREPETVRSDVSWDIQHSVQLDHLLVTVEVFTGTGTVTCKLEVNSSAGNPQVSMTTTGTWEDVTNTRSVVAGDTLNYEVVVPAAITLRPVLHSLHETAAASTFSPPITHRTARNVLLRR